MMRRLLFFWTEEKSLSVFLVLLVLEIFVITPIQTQDHFFLSVVNGVVGSLVILTGLLTIAQHRLTRWLALGLVVAALAVRWLSLLTPTPLLQLTGNMLALCVDACFAVVVLQKVYKDGPVTAIGCAAPLLPTC